MKIIIFFLALLFLVIPVHADYNQSYSDYQFLYSQYRKSFQDFSVAKATFLTYKTLTTQNDVIEKMRTVLSSRADIASGYINLIMEKTTTSEGIPASQITTFQKVVNLENGWLEAHKRQIAAAETLEDLNTISQNFDSHYPAFLNETKKAIGTILVSKNDFAYAKLPDLFARVNNYADNITSQRSLAVARSKAELWESKRADAIGGKEFDLYKSQQLMIEGLQYLKESTNFLKEIVNQLL